MITSRLWRNPLVAVLAVAVLAAGLALAKVPEARATEPAPDGMPPACAPDQHVGNNCVPAASPDTVAPPVYSTQYANPVAGDPYLHYSFETTSYGVGPSCPHDGFGYEAVPCQTGTYAFARVYDPSRPVTDDDGGVPYNRGGGVAFTTLSCVDVAISCVYDIGVAPFIHPHGVTLIIHVYGGWEDFVTPVDPVFPHNFDGKGFDYVEVLTLLPGSPPAPNDPPTVKITKSVSNAATRTFQLNGSTSTPGGTATITGYHWELSDDTTSDNATFSHAFAKGGPYTAKLTVTQSDGKSASKEVQLMKPPVEVSIEPALDAIVPKGDGTVDVVLKSLVTTPAKVTLSTPLAVRDALLTITPPAGAGTEQTVPAGGQKKLTFALKAGETLGVDQLQVRGTAKDSDNIVYDLSQDLDYAVSNKDVEPILTFDPKEITLEETKDGPVPDDVVLHASVTNLSAEPLTGVSLLLGKPGWQTTNPNSTYVPSDVVALKEPVTDDEYALDDLAVGEKVELDIPVTVKDDGHIEWGGLLKYTKGDKEKLEHVTPGKLTSVPTFLSRFELKDWPSGERVDASIDDLPGGIEPWNTDQIVKAGEDFGVYGEMENLTTDQVVMQELPTTGLKNATCAIFRSVSSEQDAALPGEDDEYGCGLPFRQLIDPGETTLAATYPSTVENETFGPGETFSSRFTVVPAAAAPHEDGTYPDAVPANVRTGPVEDLTASAATMTPPALPSPYADESYLGRFAIGYVDGGIKFVKGTSETVGWILTKIPEVPGMSVTAATKFMEVAGRFATTISAAAYNFYNLTPAERDGVIQGVKDDLVAFWLVKAPDATAATLTALRNGVDQVFQKILYAAFEDPDPGAFWQSLGGITSQVIGEVSLGWVTDAAMAKLLTRLKFAKGFKLADEFLKEAAANVGFKLEKGLAGIKAGTYITDKMLATAVGITRAQKDYMLKVAEKWGVNIYARSRGAGAIDLIERGLATMKPYFVKPKSVNDIDRLFLGFEKLPKEIVAMREPPPIDVLKSRLAAFRDEAGNALTPDQEQLVYGRWQQRNKEWWGDKGDPIAGINPLKDETSTAFIEKSERYKLMQKDGKKVDLTLETDGNMEDKFNGKDFQVKPTEFRLGQAPRAKNGVYDPTGIVDTEAIVPQFFEKGVWKTIVGDVDLVAITKPDGTLPDLHDLLKIYADLQKPPLDMQHSATLTFALRDAAADLLRDHIGDASEPLVEFGVGQQLRAVRFDPKMDLSPEARFAKGAQFIHLAGGQIHAYRSWATGAAITTVATNEAHQSYAPPSTYDADMDRSAPITRMGENGPETLVDGVWTPSSGGVSTQAVGGPVVFGGGIAPAAAEERLRIGVQTAVDQPVAKGQTHLPVLSLAELYPDGAAGQEWFAEGDEVIVDPGSPAAFHTTLASVGGELVLADPLPAAVVPGTMVAMVPEPVQSAVGSGTPGTGELPKTGTDVAELLALAVVLLVTGRVLTRRRSAR